MGYGLQAYLQSLRDRNEMMANEYARKKAFANMVIQQVANVGGEVAHAIEADKKKKGEYQYAWKEAGMPGFDPNVPTPTDAKLDALKVKRDSIISKSVATEKGQSFKELDVLNRQLEDVNKELARLETWRKTPEYVVEKENSSFKKFLGIAPVDSGMYYEIMNGGKKDKSSDLEAYRKKKEIDAIYKNASSKGDKAFTNIKYLKDQYDKTMQDIAMPDEEKYSALEKIYEQMVAISKQPELVQSDKATARAVLPTPPKAPVPEPKKETRKERKDREQREKDEALMQSMMKQFK